MIKILKEHLERYPQMQIQDVAKLIYQNEFGGGHLISDKEKCLKRIQEEYQCIAQDSIPYTPCIESIGNGMCRIHLSALSHSLSDQVLNEIFIQSANSVTGTINSLEKKILLCLSACKDGLLPFSYEQASVFFSNWKKQGYPAISHSDTYRKLYKPAYRVAAESFGKIFEIIQKIEKERPAVIAIDGMCAAGKTTLGKLIHLNYPESNLFHMDDYFLRPHQRTSERLSEIGGNVDYERFNDEIISHIRDKNGLSYHIYDCQTQSLSSAIFVPWRPLTIIEGSYSHHPYFGNPYDFKIFCKISSDEQKNRILTRNGPEMLKRFVNEWIPKENAYFELYKSSDITLFLNNTI